MNDSNFRIEDIVDSIKIRQQLEERHEARIIKYETDGSNEGQLDLPRDEDTKPSEIEFTIRNDYKGDIQYLVGIGLHLLDEPHFQYNKLVAKKQDLTKNLDKIQKDGFEKIEQNKNRKLKEVQENHDLNLADIQRRKKKIITTKQDAEHEFGKVSERIGRSTPIIYLKSKWVERLILGFLGLCEIPLNYQVFANFLLPNIETYILASLLVIAIPVLAHFSGIFLRQYKENKHYLLYFAIIFVAVTALNVVTGFMRTEYISQLSEEAPSFSSTTFIILSTILFLVGIVVSFFHHDKSQELVEAYSRYQSALKTYEEEIAPLNEEENSANKDFLDDRKLIEEEYEKENKKIENLVIDLENEIKFLVRKHDSILNTFKGFEKEIDSKYKMCLSKYRAANHRNRKNGIRPACWNKVNSLELEFHKKEELDPNKEI
ncbi:MAG: hypothetical protein AAGA77_19385 [Bacteroidota bacterium]